MKSSAQMASSTRQWRNYSKRGMSSTLPSHNLKHLALMGSMYLVVLMSSTWRYWKTEVVGNSGPLHPRIKSV